MSDEAPAAPVIFQALSRREWMQNKKGAVWATEHDQLEAAEAEAEAGSASAPVANQREGAAEELNNSDDSSSSEVAVGATCVVEYDFEDGADDSKLTLLQGQVVVITEMGDDGWVAGKLQDGREGWFPTSYISIKNRPALPPPPALSPIRQQGSSGVSLEEPAADFAARTGVAEGAGEASETAAAKEGVGVEDDNGSDHNETAAMAAPAPAPAAADSDIAAADELNTTVASISSIGEAMR